VRVATSRTNSLPRGLLRLRGSCAATCDQQLAVPACRRLRPAACRAAACDQRYLSRRLPLAAPPMPTKSWTRRRRRGEPSLSRRSPRDGDLGFCAALEISLFPLPFFSHRNGFYSTLGSTSDDSSARRVSVAPSVRTCSIIG
jgi:hypothetical protein